MRIRSLLALLVPLSACSGVTQDLGHDDPLATPSSGEAPPPSASVPDGAATREHANADERLLLVGGDGFGGATFDEMWSWDGARWTREPTRLPRSVVGAVVARTGDAVLLFGGRTVREMSNATLADTFVWDGTAWHEQRPDTRASARAHAAFASLGARVVMFGGYGDTDQDGRTTTLGDTWTWEGARWREEAPAHAPPARATAAAAALDDRVVLFGGLAGTTALGDTWIWDGATWTEVRTPGPPPTASPTMAAFHDRILLVAGGATWAFDGTSWSRTTAVTPDVSGSMAELGGALYLFDGRVREGERTTWRWDGGAWTPLSPVAGPTTRSGAQLVRAPIARRAR